jgi:hypothetical protein
MKNLIVLIIICAFYMTAQAQTTFTWTGEGTSPNWNDQGNWSWIGTPPPNPKIPNSTATSGTLVHNVIIPASQLDNKWPVVNGSYSFNNIEFINSTGPAGTRINWFAFGTTILNVYGNWTNNISDANDGLTVVSTDNRGFVRFLGNKNTTFNGKNRFREVAINKTNNTNTVTMAEDAVIELVHGFYPRRGNWIINGNTGTRFTLLATPPTPPDVFGGRTAFIYGVTDANPNNLGAPIGTITGNVVVSTYIPQFDDVNGNFKDENCTARDVNDWYNFADGNTCNEANYRFFSSPINDNNWYLQLIEGYTNCQMPSGPITGPPTSGPESVEIYPFVGLRWHNNQWTWGYSCWRFFNETYNYTCHGQTLYPWAQQWTPMWLRYFESDGDPRPETRFGPGPEFDCQEDMVGNDFYYGYKGFANGTNFNNKLEGLLCHGQIRGTNAGRTNRIITWEGTVNNGDITGSFTHTNNLQGDGVTPEDANGINLAGNPYPSPISWSKMYDDGTLNDFEKTVSIWHNNGSWTNSGSVLSFDAETGEGDFDGDIAIGQAFWIKPLNVGTTTLTLKNAHRLNVSLLNITTGGPRINYYRIATESTNKNIFGFELSGGPGNSDRSFIVIGDKYKDEYEPEVEGAKVLSAKNSICSVVGNHRLVFNKLPLALGQYKEIPLQVTTHIAAKFTIKPYKFNIDENLYKVYLLDKEANKIQVFNPTSEFTFTSKGKTENGRFYLIIADKNLQIEKGLSMGFDVNYEKDVLTMFFKSPIEGELFYTITDLSGRVLKKTSQDNVGSKLVAKQSLTPGIYLITCHLDGVRKTQKMIVR